MVGFFKPRQKLILACLLLPVLGWADNAAVKMVLTSQENGMENQTNFSCNGTIHAYLTLPSSAVGKHTVEGIWTGPQGKDIQHSFDQVDFPIPGKRTAAVWLSFANSSGAWNPLSNEDRGDQDHRLWDGPWQLTVRWDGHDVALSKFQVHCS